jgi:pyruvate,water dikinase
MGILRHRLERLFKKSQPPEPSNVEALRIEFKDRYHSFKLLLNANNRALEIMADIQQALSAGRPFGMSFIRSRCTSLSVNVFSMIKYLERLAPGRYQGLMAAFNAIQPQIDQLLTAKKIIRDRSLIVPLTSVDKHMADLVGTKMANLGEIKHNIHLKVPDGFVFSAFAYQRFIEHNDLQTEIDRRIQSSDAEDIQALYGLSSEIQQLIIRSQVPPDLQAAATEAWRKLEDGAGKKITVALRSSAIGEDIVGSSFAGQYRSILNVSSENILEAYKEILASKYSLQAITYRLNKGFRDEDVAMCVGCLLMIDAEAGGVTYTRNPVDMHDDSVFINSAWGLPKSVVDGSGSCDLFVVSREKPLKVVHRNIRIKEQKYICFPEEGVCRMELTGAAKALPSINPSQALVLAELALKMEEFYGSPQDIEWAIDVDDTIYVLQCRPLQPRGAPDAAYPAAAAPAAATETILAAGGVTASPGAAADRVYVVEKGSDVLAFPDGAILVTRQALPRWAPLLNRAGAVITEMGGFAGHLANLAREFGVPALFGVQGVLSKLTPGDLITVDAGGRTIYKGRIDALLTESIPPKNLMQDTPVYAIMKKISRHIVPLNLLDPDAPEFNPKNCKTLHDITRFIHEKSVREMFNFGKDHNFSERSSKQLYYKVPMQWWVLNLDDGVRQEVNGKYLKLENIVSIPMLAFWKGFTAIPWEGPPAIDGKGFLSVMFQSTTNRELTTGMRSSYAERNYFMISKNFCSLTSRLGYHFSILEALVSEHAGENYISFQFKGGAADFRRRHGRVYFIAEILEKQGFRVEIKEDHLIARIENHEMEFMKKRLEILGYLSLHTRQIDMIMSNPARVNYYRKKIEKDIQKLLTSAGLSNED